MKIAILGAPGTIGVEVGRELSRHGESFRVISRNRSKLEAAFGKLPGAEIHTANLTDPSQVEVAVAGCDTVIYTLGLPYDQFAAWPTTMAAAVQGMERSGVARVLLVTNIYPYGKPRTARISEDHPRNPCAFKGQMRLEQENLLLESQAAGRLKAIVLRLPDFYGPEATQSVTWGIFQAALQGKTADLLGPVDTPHEFVFTPDVGPLIYRLLNCEAAYGQTIHLAGPGTITMREFAAEVYRQAGTRFRCRVANRTVLRLLGLFNPTLRELVEMTYLFTDPLLLDDSKLRSLIGDVNKTPYPEGIRRTLDSLLAQNRPAMKPRQD